MSARAYDNFDLLVESIDAARFRVRVTHCEAGDSPALITSLPFSDIELENVLLKLDPGRSGTRRLLDPYAQASVDMGAGLYDADFGTTSCWPGLAVPIRREAGNTACAYAFGWLTRRGLPACRGNSSMTGRGTASSRSRTALR